MTAAEIIPRSYTALRNVLSNGSRVFTRQKFTIINLYRYWQRVKNKKEKKEKGKKRRHNNLLFLTCKNMRGEKDANSSFYRIIFTTSFFHDLVPLILKYYTHCNKL